MKRLVLFTFLFVIGGCSNPTENPGCNDLNCDGWPDIVFANRYKGESAQIESAKDYHIDSYVYWGGPGYVLF